MTLNIVVAEILCRNSSLAKHKRHGRHDVAYLAATVDRSPLSSKEHPTRSQSVVTDVNDIKRRQDTERFQLVLAAPSSNVLRVIPIFPQHP